jgi:hypothetical protein
MALFMDYHEDLKLPVEALAQIAEDTATPGPTGSACARSSPATTPTGGVYCLLDGPDQDAIRQHHTALGVLCGEVHPGRQPHLARTNRTIAARAQQ